MKKLLLLLSLSPLAVMGQHFDAKTHAVGQAVKFNPYKQYGEGAVASPVRINKGNPVPRQKATQEYYNLNMINVGESNYDLMSNGSMPRRIKAYENGKISIVWTYSGDNNADFPNRGTAYNHFNGTSWIGQQPRNEEGFTTYEAPGRTGWPNIVSYTEGGTERELIVSHFAETGSALQGGTSWLENDAVGDADFDSIFTNHKGNGPVWPRVAVTGDKVHMIGNFSNGQVIEGIKNPVVYYRYNLTTNAFEVENQLLPGYKARYAQGRGDEYSIDARGNTVAILIGGMVNDLTLWKSNDKGDNWTTTIIDSFPNSPWYFDPDKQTLFGQTVTNDGTGTVTLDNGGVAHVFYPLMVVENTAVGPTDSTFSYYPRTDSIAYWNDLHEDLKLVAWRIDYSDEFEVLEGTYEQTLGSYGGNAASTYPVGAVDANGNLYMIYSSINEMDINSSEDMNFRDLYIVYSEDTGKTWSEIQSVTGNPSPNGFTYREDVFPSLSRDVVNGNLHLMWMQDEEPGIFLVNESSIVTNEIMYAAIPTADILNDELGLKFASVKQGKNNNNIIVGDVYPNPATSTVTIPVQLKTTANVTVKIVDMLGKTISEGNQTTLTAGKSNLTLDVANLTAGVYFCQVNAGGYTETQKIVVK